ncbi:MAG TPA: hypothetical protein VKV05_05925 [Terriglobales bacterium]|jgi:hypothetical protein|nr:hypothetical protein [Terriglobales bacterium]
MIISQIETSGTSVRERVLDRPGLCAGEVVDVPVCESRSLEIVTHSEVRSSAAEVPVLPGRIQWQ